MSEQNLTINNKAQAPVTNSKEHVDDDISISYCRDNVDCHTLGLNSEALSDIKVNYENIPEDKRGGTAVKLLAASSLYCFAATLSSSLTSRGANVKSLTGKARVIKGEDEVYRTKVQEIVIDVFVDIDDEDEKIFNKVKNIMRRGCLVTYSLEDAIDIEYNIHRLGH